MNKENDTFKAKITKFAFIVATTSVLMMFAVPLLLEYTIYRNNIFSVISNAEWSSFFGSFIGGIIGAIIAGSVTLYGIKLSIDHNAEIIKKERDLQTEKDKEREKMRNRPFLHFSYKGSGGEPKVKTLLVLA